MDVRNLLRPLYLFHRATYELYVLSHQDEPWIAQTAVQFCQERLTKDQTGLEWGSGRSTAWFATRLGRLLSIEFDKTWHEKVVRNLAQSNCSNAECRYIPLDHPLNEPTPPHYDELPAYVAVSNEFEDNSLDIVIVDGHYRQACVLAAIPKIKRGGNVTN
jgi:hypothetical protein